MDKAEKRDYEIAFLVQNKGDESAIEKILLQHGVELIDKGRIQEIKLSYPIKKCRLAHFGFWRLQIKPDLIESIRQSLKLVPSVLRVLIVALSDIEAGKSRKTVRKPKTTVGQNAAEPVFKPDSSSVNVLSNEALEKKLEEILK